MKRYVAPGLIRTLAPKVRTIGAPEISGLGPMSAAAWLMWRYRKTLVKRGAVDFQIPRGTPPPRYFVVAMEVLKTRPGWDVIHMGRVAQQSHSGMEVWRVRWLRWGRIAERSS